ncbi:MAG: glycosyltransferase [Planctomycetota bacterium]
MTATRPLRITMLDTGAEAAAGRCAGDLVAVLAARGHDARRLVGETPDDADDRVRRLPRGRLESGLQRALHRRLGLTDTVPLTPLRLARTDPWLRGAEVVHVHRARDGVSSLWALPRLARACPLVVTLHDMWLLTGDCDHAGSCGRWQRHCGPCPVCRLPRPERGPVGGRDLTRLNHFVKRSVFRRIARDRLVLAAPSRWMARQAGASHLRRFRTVVIPPGVDGKRFAPADRGEARRRLDVDPDAPLLAAIAGDWDARRRGLALLLDAARILTARGAARVVVAGPMRGAVETALAGAGATVRPGLRPADDVRTMLAAADAALVTASAAGAPAPVCEALACGCPPVALDVGGVSEMLAWDEHGFTLPSSAGPRDIAACVDRLLAEPPETRAARRRRARAHAESAFGVDRMADDYEALYREITAET